MTEVQYVTNFDRNVYNLEQEVIVKYADIEQQLHITSQEILSKPITQQEYCKPIKIIAIYGMITLKELSYLIVVTKASLVGSIHEKQIYLADQVEFIPIDKAKISSNDKPYINDLQYLFRTKTFYFSEYYDLTNSHQRQLENEGIRKPISYYCVNYELMKPFRSNNPEVWIPMFISGLIAIKHCKVNQYECQLILISRRDTRRMGRRFINRGADLEGNCTNFAETEQIFTYNNQIFSFLQTRGSMPFKWQQKPNLTWSPKGRISADENKNLEIATKHFVDQFQLGIHKCVIVNLIDKKGTQKMLGDYFDNVVLRMKNKNIIPIWFDFHAECKNMNYEKLAKLVDYLRSHLEQGDMCHYEAQHNAQQKQKIKVISTQKCIIRTNCMDCLDRTNVVQSVIARHMLWGILIRMGLNKEGNSPMQAFPKQLEDLFRDIWTRNADTISLLYTGTGALKTDSTKYGKRTTKGAAVDGYRAVTRYFIGNFSDGNIQNSIDLLTGKINVKTASYNQPSIFTNGLVWFMLMFGSILCLAFKGSEQLIAIPNVKTTLRIDDDPQNQLNMIKIWTFRVMFTLACVILGKSIIFSNHKKLVHSSKLSH